MKKWQTMAFAASAGLLLAACGEETAPETQQNPDDDTAEEEGAVEEEGATEETNEVGTDPEMASLQIEMYNSDSELVGTATFDESEEGVMLHLNLEDVPAGEFGMHIHEVGEATPPSFEDAGDHFNPTDAEHGFDSEDGHHLGDLPNLEVPENGVVNETIEIPEVSLLPDAEYTLSTEEGTSLIIHTEPDDYESQPSGEAGERMIGGIIFSPEN